MRQIANFTNQNPGIRVDKLNAFNARLHQSAKSIANFREWNFELEKKLVTLGGRCLANEPIFVGDHRT